MTTQTTCSCGRPAGPRKVCLDCVESYFGKGVIPAPITSVIVEPPDSQCAQFRWYARCGSQTQEGAERTHADAEERANRWILKTRLEVNHV